MYGWFIMDHPTNTFTTKSSNMKHIFLFLFIASTLSAFGQQDSVVYKKFKNGGKTTITIDLPITSMFTLDSGYYKLRFSVNLGSLNISIDPFTDIDSLMGNTLFNDFTDASRQYKQVILASEETEKGYELKLRQAEKQYKEFTGENIKDKVESEFDFTELLGDWLLNGKAITIDAKLEIGKKPIKILSDQQFTVEIDKEQRVFNRIKAGRWIAKDERYKLERPGKPKNKK